MPSLTVESFHALASSPGRLFIRYLVDQRPTDSDVEISPGGPIVYIDIVTALDDQYLLVRYKASHLHEWLLFGGFQRYMLLQKDVVPLLIVEWRRVPYWETPAPEVAIVASNHGSEHGRDSFAPIPVTSWLLATHILRVRDRLQQDMFNGINDKIPVDALQKLQNRIRGLVRQIFDDRIRIDGV